MIFLSCFSLFLPTTPEESKTRCGDSRGIDKSSNGANSANSTFWVLFEALKFHDENNVSNPKRFTHSSLLEIIWTIIPAIILLFMAIPSFSLLYSLDESINPDLTLKVIGHQWYWSYEYSDYNAADGESINFDSYMIPEEDLEPGNLRLLEVDNRIVLPVETHVRVVITSADVLHCWAIPSFGIKMDACPGRLNQTSMFIKREGVYYGQCSEICGVNHGFMPICIEAVSLEDYVAWISSKIELAEESV